MTENKIHIGGLTLKVLSDGILEFDPCVFFPSTTEDDWIPHKSHLNHNSNVQGVAAQSVHGISVDLNPPF